jgi:hypothetical protein
MPDHYKRIKHSLYEGAAEWIEAVSKSSGLSLSTELGILMATMPVAILWYGFKASFWVGEFEKNHQRLASSLVI